MAFVGAQLMFAHLPDKIGGTEVALVCVLIEAANQLLIRRADNVWTAYAGPAMTGFGFLLAFPGFGVEAVHRPSPQTRGAAMEAFDAFLDISLGITGPVAGAFASAASVSTVYLVGAAAVALAAVVAMVLLLTPLRPVA